jgi:hypothetical protein
MTASDFAKLHARGEDARVMAVDAGASLVTLTHGCCKEYGSRSVQTFHMCMCTCGRGADAGDRQC